MKRIYLDIDGVLLTQRNQRISEGAIDFLNYLLQNFDCYWLTTHCHNNDTSAVIGYLSQFFPNNMIENLKSVKPVVWDTLKTEGIDFDSDFYWIDDYPLESEKKVLEQHNCLENLIQVNLDNKDELLHLVQKLKILNEKNCTFVEKL